MRNAECGMRNAECGMRDAECGMRNAECGNLQSRKAGGGPHVQSRVAEWIRRWTPSPFAQVQTREPLGGRKMAVLRSPKGGGRPKKAVLQSRKGGGGPKKAVF